MHDIWIFLSHNFKLMRLSWSRTCLDVTFLTHSANMKPLAFSVFWYYNDVIQNEIRKMLEAFSGISDAQVQELDEEEESEERMQKT